MEIQEWINSFIALMTMNKKGSIFNISIKKMEYFISLYGAAWGYRPFALDDNDVFCHFLLLSLITTQPISDDIKFLMTT